MTDFNESKLSGETEAKQEGKESKIKSGEVSIL